MVNFGIDINQSLQILLSFLGRIGLFGVPLTDWFVLLFFYLPIGVWSIQRLIKLVAPNATFMPDIIPPDDYGEPQQDMEDYYLEEARAGGRSDEGDVLLAHRGRIERSIRRRKGYKK